VNRPVDNSGRETVHGGSWVDTEVSSDDGRSGVFHTRGTREDREIRGGQKRNWRWCSARKCRLSNSEQPDCETDCDADRTQPFGTVTP
jgi:hypothetical protein